MYEHYIKIVLVVRYEYKIYVRKVKYKRTIGIKYNESTV